MQLDRFGRCRKTSLPFPHSTQATSSLQATRSCRHSVSGGAQRYKTTRASPLHPLPGAAPPCRPMEGELLVFKRARAQPPDEALRSPGPMVAERFDFGRRGASVGTRRAPSVPAPATSPASPSAAPPLHSPPAGPGPSDSPRSVTCCPARLSQSAGPLPGWPVRVPEPT